MFPKEFAIGLSGISRAVLTTGDTALASGVTTVSFTARHWAAVKEYAGAQSGARLMGNQVS